MKIRSIKTGVTLLLTAVITFLQVLTPCDRTAIAATTYITVEAFAEALAKEIRLDETSGNASNGYINALIEKGMIKEGEFTAYTQNLTRTDTAVLINRADEYLYGDKLDEDLVELALEKRISDINSIPTIKRNDVVKCYLKGYIKGYSNGEYSTDRQFRGSKKISKTGALECIKMLKNKDIRAKISPDGQLIRTTKLPVYAKYYPYILASFPNEYYDWKFEYEWYTWTQNGKPIELKNLVDYAAPVDVDKITFFGDFSKIKEERMDIWINDAKTFLHNLLNVDYREIDDEWIDMMIETNEAYLYNEEMMREYMEEYLKEMKENKTIVECNSIDIDGSSLYYTDTSLFLRVHVKYRVVSSKAPLNVDVDTLIENWSHNKILFSQSMVNIRGRKLGEWMDGYYEIKLARYAGIVNGSQIRINDAQYRARMVSK